MSTWKKWPPVLVIREVLLKSIIKYDFTVITHISVFSSGKWQVLAKMWTNWNLHALLLRVKNGAGSWKTLWNFCQKVNPKLPYDPAHPLPGRCWRGWIHKLQQVLALHRSSSVIQSNAGTHPRVHPQKNGWIKEAYTYSRTFFSRNEWYSDISFHMDEPLKTT